ncbi:MAG: Rne/Rng family ribonuclease, partial [Acidimicrobiales bacterium]
ARASAALASDDREEGEQGRRSGRRRRGGRDRRAKSTGRYLICVHVQPGLSQIAVLEGRTLVQHFVSRAADETSQIDGNIYLGRVQNVLPGMEAAFVDIGIPKNAVLYRGDVRYDTDDVEGGRQASQPRIEEMLRPGQMILCQVTKNPIGAKGARLTQEVSLPGRFAVFVPNSDAVGISKRLGDNERRRLRKIVDAVRPAGHGLIVRTAAEGATEDELRRDVEGLLDQWRAIESSAAGANAPGLLYREPDLAVRILREELNSEYRGVVIDDPTLFDQVCRYVATVSPELAERVEHYDPEVEAQALFDRYHVHEQLHKALDRKVWLPSGGSLIIERTEALTVIDVNTGKNVGKSNLEETVYRNNLEAAEEVARQLRLRDIGGIIVIDFIDMEVRENRDKVAGALRTALARDKTRTQVFDISELGLVEMTRKRISEGLIESLSTECEICHGRGIVLDASAL